MPPEVNEFDPISNNRDAVITGGGLWASFVTRYRPPRGAASFIERRGSVQRVRDGHRDVQVCVDDIPGNIPRRLAIPEDNVVS